jgi:phage terminase large subunit-like protein
LVLLIKNWPSDPLVGFEAQGGLSKDVDEFVEAEEEILDLLDAKFPNEVESYVEECVQSWDMFP